MVDNSQYSRCQANEDTLPIEKLREEEPFQTSTSIFKWILNNYQSRDMNAINNGAISNTWNCKKVQMTMDVKSQQSHRGLPLPSSSFPSSLSSLPMIASYLITQYMTPSLVDTPRVSYTTPLKLLPKILFLFCIQSSHNIRLYYIHNQHIVNNS